ncbi:3-phosphoinositide-dependent protein kinase 2 [Linum grandiflorum]
MVVHLFLTSIASFFYYSEVRVEGLETLDYLDNLCQRERFTEQGDALTFESERDIWNLEEMLAMENDFDSKLRIQGGNSSSVATATSSSSAGANSGNPPRSNSFSFRAPQENFSIQDFELGKIYGVGSYSKVVRAKKKDTGIVYALKIMDKKFITKENKTAYVKLERIVLDQLDHPGVVRLYFTFQDTFSLYMALESCEGGELFDQITRKHRLSEEEARFYAAEIVDALEYIHKMGLIHRDIKPENLLLTADGHIKIADFGSVKPMQDSRITVLPNASSDDKACTFVGTAAYVPPEVLNSSPATFGNDLWALGCTLYQMLSGSSPFKDASEWLIFQRIVARDIRFPDYFSEEARDVIDRLLDMEPGRRPGAGPEGYGTLKMHPFFKGVDWDNLRSQTPPELAADPTVQSSEGSEPDSWNPTHVGDSSVPHDGNVPASPTPETYGHVTRLASIDSFDSRWQQFLDPGESVIMISMVKKLQKLSSKKVQLILTNKPKLIYVDPSKLVVKGNIIWSDNSDDLSVQVTSPSNFKICSVIPAFLVHSATACLAFEYIVNHISFLLQPKKVLSFEDTKQRALQWKKAIETLQNRKGSYLGLITVYSPEETAFFSTGAFKPDPILPFLDLSGRRFKIGTVHGERAVYVRCGVGLVNAAAATQQMVDTFKITGIIHFGISGNLNNSMNIGDVSVPSQIADTGLWNWQNPDVDADPAAVAHLQIGNFNVPKGDGVVNELGQIGYSLQQLYSASSVNPNTPASLLWMNVTRDWLHLAAAIQEMELQQCVNATTCLDQKPKVVVGLRASTSDIFVDNKAYRDFLFQTFQVSSSDMESSAVVMVCLSNGYPVIVIRGMSDIAGKQSGTNAIKTFGSLAALNTANVVLEFISKLRRHASVSFLSRDSYHGRM